MGSKQETYEDLIRKLLADVTKPAEQKPTLRQDQKHLLVLVCGGLTSADEAASQLKYLDSNNYRLQVLFTESGSRILGSRWLEKAGLQDVQVLADAAEAFVTLNSSDAVVVPVMTLNTASKVANGIADNAVTTMIMHALLGGKPVIAAKDACDPSRLCDVRMVKEPLYYATLAANIIVLEQFGIKMVNACDIGSSVENELGPLRIIPAPEKIPAAPAVPAEKSKETPESIFEFTGKVLSAAEVVTCKAGIIQIRGKVIVTPSAFDKAKELNVRIVKV